MKAMLRALCAALAIFMLCTALAESAEPLPPVIEAASEIPAEVEEITLEPQAEEPQVEGDAAEFAAEPSPEAGGEESPAPEAGESPAPEPEASAPADAPGGSLRLDNGDLTIGYKETVRGALLPVPADGAISYSSSNAKIVRVDAATGELYGAKTGSAVITAALPDGASASCAVTVRKAPTKLTLKAEATTLGVGESVGIAAGFSSGAYSYNITYSSTDDAVARVEKGKIIAGDWPGTATISGKTFNGKKASVKITVKPGPEELRFTSADTPMGAGMARDLAAAVNDGAAGTPSFAIVRGAEFAELEGSTLTAKAPGEVVLRASVYNGVFAEQTLTVLPAPQSLTATPEAVSVSVGETIKAPVLLATDTGADPAPSYKSSNSKIAAVSAEGAITGKKAGSATITVTAYSGASASYAVTVYKAPSKIKITAPKALGLGERATPAVSTSTKGAALGAYTLSSSNSSVIAVEGNSILAVGEGSAKITAKSYNKKTASATISVKPAPTELHFTGEPVILGVGMTLPLEAEVNEGAAGAIQYSVSRGAELASMVGNALVAGQAGEITVRAEAYNGVFAEREFTILPAPSSVNLQETQINMGLKETLKGALHASLEEGSGGSWSFKSSKSSVVAVDPATGALTAKKKGTAEIRAVAYNGVESAPCTVVVSAAPTKISLTVPSKGASVGMEQTASVSLKGGSGSWTLTSDNPSVIEVRGADKLVATGIGIAKITAKSYNGKKASVSITVISPPTEVQPARESADMVVNMPEKLEFLTPGSYASYSYESSAPAVASVAEDGTVNPLAEGEAVITATTHNGLTASTLVRVHPAAREIAFEAAEVELGVGEKLKLQFRTLPEGSLAKYSYKSSSSSTASVDEGGVVSGMKAGVAVITVAADCGPGNPKPEAALTIHVVDYNALHPTESIAHRGASAYREENTLEAFDYAAALGSDWIETDVRLTADNEIVLFHDANIAVSSKKKRAISAMTLDEIRAINPNVPTLQDGLDCIQGLPLKLLIEFKDTGADIERRVVQAVQQHGMMDRTYFGSFTQACVERIHANYPPAKTVFIIGDEKLLKQVIQKPATYDFFEAVSVRYTVLSTTYVRDLHLRGIYVSAWTPLTQKDIDKVEAMGVDGITTNYPDRV